MALRLKQLAIVTKYKLTKALAVASIVGMISYFVLTVLYVILGRKSILIFCKTSQHFME